MILKGKRHKEAKVKGYQARIGGKTKNDNYYSVLGKTAQVYASLWDAGWIEADKNMKDRENES